MMDNYETLLDILKKEKNTENIGITYINELGEEKYVSYQDTYQKSLRLLGRLQKFGMKSGDELVIQIEDEEDFISTSWACLLGGMIAVPLPMAEKEEHIERIIHIFRILNNPFLITTTEKLQEMNEYIRTTDNKEEWEIVAKEKSVLIDKESEKTTDFGIISPGKSSDIAFLMFSSGSTGEPKGVIMTHENLISQLISARKHYNGDENDKFLSWMPLTHTIGMSFHLSPVEAGVPQYIMSKTFFVKNPLQWMDKISEHNITMFCTPNFGVKHFLEEFSEETDYKWDLSSVKAMVDAGEPISPILVHEFNQKMANYSFDKKALTPAYGMTEACMGISAKSLEEDFQCFYLDRRYISVGDHIRELEKENANSNVFVCVGNIMECCNVRICNLDDELLEDGVIGTIQFQGTCMTPGYYNDTESTKNAYTLDGWFKTGDAGFLKDGKLTITGRTNDMIIANGKNYFAYDIERVAGEMNGNTMTAVCGVFDSLSKKENVLLFFLSTGTMEESMILGNEIKKYVISKTGLQIKYCIPVQEIPKTQSGKLQRFKLKERFLNGDFGEIIQLIESYNEKYQEEKEHTAPQNEIQTIIKDVWSRILGIENIGIDDDFFELGGDSMNAMYALSELKLLGIKISEKYFMEHPNIRELSTFSNTVNTTANEDFEEDENETVEIPLLPNRAILDRRNDKGDVDHWNIGVMLETYPIPKKEQMEKVVRYLLKYHDGLRLRLYKEETEWKQYVEKLGDELPIEYIDLSSIDEESQADAIEDLAEEFQGQITLSERPVLIGVFYLGEDRPARILLIAHHEIVDGYAMSILIQDFCTAYSEVMKGEEIKLPLRTTSMKNWANFLKSFAQKEELLMELLYWMSGAVDLKHIPLDYPSELKNNYFKYERILGKYILTKEETEILYKNIINRDVQLNDIIVTAILSGMKKWTGYTETLLDYTMNGRYPLDDNIDLSRTVGWTSFLVPIYFDYTEKTDLLSLLSLVKEQLHTLPNGGIGYGCLRYLCNDEEILEFMSQIPYPEVTYNYFRNDVDQSDSPDDSWGYIKIAKESAGENEGENISRGRLIDFVTEYHEDQLYFKILYSCNIHKEETMEILYGYIKEELDHLLHLLQNQ